MPGIESMSIESIPGPVMGLILVGILVAAVLLCLSSWIHVVPPNRIKIVERLGHYNRTLSTGAHLVMWPLESVRTVEWRPMVESTDHNGQTLTRPELIRTNCIRLDNAQLDIPSVSCITSDRVAVDINGSILYKITDVHTAIYKVDDVLNHLVQCASQGVRAVTNRLELNDIYGKERDIVSDYLNDINALVVDFGIVCTSFTIQELEIDESMVKSNEKAYAKIQNERALMQQEEVEHQRMMKKHAHDVEQQRARHENEHVCAEHEAALAASRWSAWKQELGTDDAAILVSLEKLRVLSQTLQAGKKLSVVQVPWSFVSDGMG